MPVNLVTRIDRLETKAGAAVKSIPKVVRIVTSDEDEAEVRRLAREAGYDDGPDSTDILVVRLIALKAKGNGLSPS
jgi:hypothetical protein